MEVTRFCVTNPMPDYVKDNQDLMQRFQLIGSASPLKGCADSINYFFQTMTVWIICFTEIFKSIFLMASETIGESMRDNGSPKEELIGWSKAVAYYSWESVCLPLVFLLGYFSEDIRKPMLFDVNCRSQENVRRTARRLEKEQEIVKEQSRKIIEERDEYKGRLDRLDDAVKLIIDDAGGELATNQTRLLLLHTQQEGYLDGQEAAEEAHAQQMTMHNRQLTQLREDFEVQRLGIERLEQEVVAVRDELKENKEELKTKSSELDHFAQIGVRRIIMDVERHQGAAVTRGTDLVLGGKFLNRYLPGKAEV